MEKQVNRNIEDIYALSPAQEGMLFQYLKNPAAQQQFEQLTLRISGNMNREIFTDAWNSVIRNHEILRSVFRWEKLKKPVQMILKESRVDIRYYDWSGSDFPGNPTNIEALLKEVLEKDKAEGFSLITVPFRITLCKISGILSEMIVSSHHILYDGWSSGIILKDFFKAYHDQSRNCPGQGVKKGKFKDFLKLVEERRNDVKQKQASETFWKNYLSAGVVTTGTLPGLKRLPGKKKRKLPEETGQFEFQVPAVLADGLNSFTRAHSITLASLLTGVWGVLLGQYNQKADVLFYTTVSGRDAHVKGIEETVGLFINTLPMRVCPGKDEVVVDFMIRLYSESLQWKQYENTPLTEINEYVEAHGDEMLIESLVVLENYPLDQQLMEEMGELKVDAFSISTSTHYDLTVIITLLAGLAVTVTYNRGLFDEQAIKYLGEHFTALLERVVTNPYGKVTSLTDSLPQEKIEVIRAGVLASLGVEKPVTPLEVLPGIISPGAIRTPGDKVEEELVRAWGDVLKIDENSIGIDSNFFDFGGHSLKATLLVSRLHRDMEVKIPLAEVFKRPTIRQMAEYIRKAGRKDYKDYQALGKAPEKSYYPLSSAQERMYFLQQLHPWSTAYNVTVVLAVEGEVGKGNWRVVFEKAFIELIGRHESLRTSFQLVEGEPQQIIHDLESVEFTLEYSEEYNENEDLSRFIRPFTLSCAPLLRVSMIKENARKHLLVIDMHHIVTDAFSMDILVKEFSAICRGYHLPGVEKQYRDFSHWQYTQLQSGQMQVQEAFWLNEFPGELPVLNMYTDFPRPAVQQFAGERVYFRLDKEASSDVYRMARETGSTIFMIFLAVFQVLLHRTTGQEDIVVGTTVAGRTHPDLERIVGLFIETLAIRSFPASRKTFGQFLEEVKKQTLAAYENGSYPFRELIKKIDRSSDMSRNPLFDVMLIVQNVDLADLQVEGLVITPRPFYRKVSKLDLTLEALEVEGEILFHIEYSVSLYKRETIERLAGHFLNLVKAVVVDRGQLLGEIEIMGEGERRQVLEEFIDSGWYKTREEWDYPCDKRIEEIFQQQVAQNPGHIAVVHNGKKLTYRQINEQADILSRLIKEL